MQCQPIHTIQFPSLPTIAIQLLLEIRRRQSLHHTRALTKPRSKDTVRILEHAILQGDNDELTALEPCLDEPSNILRVRQIERGVDFVEDVHGCRFELEEGHDEGEGDERPVIDLVKYSLGGGREKHTVVHHSTQSATVSTPCPNRP
jgi:hypothetical protein